MRVDLNHGVGDEADRRFGVDDASTDALLDSDVVLGMAHVQHDEGHFANGGIQDKEYDLLLLTFGSYFALNFLYAILLVSESVGHLTGGFKDFSWITVCNLKWGFFLLHQAWFLVAPIAIMSLEAGKGNKPPGSDIAITVFNEAKRQFNNRMVRMP